MQSISFPCVVYSYCSNAINLILMFIFESLVFANLVDRAKQGANTFFGVRSGLHDIVALIVYVCQALLRYVCCRITDIGGDFIIILYFISLRGLSISMAISYIQQNT